MKRIALALSVLGGAMAHAADDGVTQLERVEVTGSNIKRSIKQELAQPISTIRTEDMTRQGFTTVEQVISSLASNQAALVSASSVQTISGGAAYASLRGLGSQYTLILLDGRRVANQAISGYATDLNAIPLSSIERIEVLRDGASAIYGTDAIGGVINFITKKSYQGVTVSGELISTAHTGGGSGNASITAGMGSLSEDGYNVYGSLSYQKTDPITTNHRDFARQYLTASNLSGRTFPGNFTYKDKAYNLASPTCQPPYSLPLGSLACGEMATLYMDLTPKVEQSSVTAKVARRIGEHTLSLQYLGTRIISTTHISPEPLTDIVTLLPGDRYYPTRLPDGTPTDGSEAVVNTRAVPLGPRVTESRSTTQRIAFNAEGVIAGWDYKGGVAYSSNRTVINFKSGYVNSSTVASAIKNGSINPFGPSPAGAWQSVELKGDGWIADFVTTMADLKFSKELFELPAGAVATAIGFEARHEKLDSKIQSIAQYAQGSGIADSKSTKGGRTVTALYAEADVPIIKNLDLQLAARYDRYTDFGNTFNPKVALKYLPMPQVMLRASASKGFRAPTLYDIYSPDNATYTANKFDDPLRCPGGVPANGGNEVNDCNTQFQNLQGGSNNLRPEKASTLSVGVVVEPVKEVTASADLWWSVVKDSIGQLDPGIVFSNPALYAERFVRNPNGSLKYVVTRSQNLGTLSAAGVDLSLILRSPKTAWGNFTVNLDGTYTSKYAQQLEPGGAYFSPLGGWYKDVLQPVVRWKHSLAFNWNNGPWSGALVQNYMAGYTDMNPKKQRHKVDSYETWNLSANYVWDKKLTLTAGIRNLLDEAPPYSNQTKSFQVGFDPVRTDPVGRSYFLKATYKM
ncbi:TonB-dependent receptor [Paludibacterium paludis]|nr:TonB-dependent receptor [Paludibacterium paludis]